MSTNTNGKFLIFFFNIRQKKNNGNKIYIFFKGTGVPQSRPTGSVFNDKNQKWQIELMMERLRSKKSQYKNFQEMSKTMRMALLVSLFFF